MRNKLLVRLILALILVFALAVSASAESHSAGTMRLLRHEGQVEIFDASGEPCRFFKAKVE